MKHNVTVALNEVIRNGMERARLVNKTCQISALNYSVASLLLSLHRFCVSLVSLFVFTGELMKVAALQV